MKHILFLMLILFPVVSKAQIITTVAGNGTWGYSGDGGQATNAQLTQGSGVAVDVSGNIFIADQDNSVIRKVDVSGRITTVVGTGSRGYSGDGGPATNAELYNPTCLAFDGSGNLYISDRWNNVIRKVNSSDIITTVAGNGYRAGTGLGGYGGDGGMATSAKLGLPWGIKFDGAGNLYIVDQSNNRIRKVSSSGIITTVAGNGTPGYSGDGGLAISAQLNTPCDVSADALGNFYIADSYNNVVRKINTLGIITTVAGNGVGAGTGLGGYSGDGSPATNAELRSPTGVYVDGSGKLIIDDGGNSIIRVVNSSGIISTIAGKHDYFGYSGDGGPATDAVLNGPVGLTVDDLGNIFIPEINSYVVRKVSLCNHIIGPITGIDSLCQGTTIFLSDTSIGGSWSSNNTSVATVGSSGNVTGISPGSAIIYYTMPGGCSAEKSVIVNTANAGTITTNAVNAFCIGDRFIVKDTCAGGVWSLSNSSGALSGDTLIAISPGYDTLFYTETNWCGTAMAVYPFYVSPSLPRISGNLKICVGDTTFLSDSVLGGMWGGGFPQAHVFSSIGDSGIVVGISAGTSVITYQMDLGCSTSVTVTVNPAPFAGIITGPDTVCRNAIFKLSESASGGIWSILPPGLENIDSISGLINTPVAATITVTYKIPPNIFGCSNSATYQLEVLQDPDFSIFGNISPIKCYGETGSISLIINGGSGKYFYLWNTSDTLPALKDIGTGIYSVYVKDEKSQCIDSAAFSIVQPDSLSATFTVQKDICNIGKGSIIAGVAGGNIPYKYQWFNNSTSNEITGLKSGIYQVTITDVNGCSAEYAVMVGDTICQQIIVHDGISPNGDGINDTWVIEGIQNYPNNLVQLFDKYGDKVFERKEYNNDWNASGKNGSLLPDGTYYYLVKLNEDNHSGGSNIFKGALLVKR